MFQSYMLKGALCALTLRLCVDYLSSAILKKPVLGLLPSHIQVQKHFVLNYNCLFYHSVVSLSYLRTAMSVGRLVNYGRRN